MRSALKQLKQESWTVPVDENGNGDRGGDTADPDNPRGWHGGNFAGLKAKIEEGYFQDMGFTAIWISPVVYQVPAIDGGDFAGGASSSTSASSSSSGKRDETSMWIGLPIGGPGSGLRVSMRMPTRSLVRSRISARMSSRERGAAAASAGAAARTAAARR